MLSELFDIEPKVFNPHQVAWMNKDWDAVKALCEEYKEKPENELFQALNAINSSKEHIDVSMMNYSKFMVDTMLSNHEDCLDSVFISNVALSGLPDQAHFNYLSMTIPNGRRFSKSTKIAEPLKDKYILKLLMEFYKVNSSTAYMYRTLLERKGNLESFLQRAKALATDEFLKTITKNPKEIKELKLL